MRIFLLLICLLQSASVLSDIDISNPRALMFAADNKENIIDVISIKEEKVIYQIETENHVDNLLSTPYAPILIYTNIEKSLLYVYDLKTKKMVKEIVLPISPRHMVLDTTGTKIAISDSHKGGFILFSPYAADIIFYIDDFPQTKDVLFDPNENEIFYTNNDTGSIGILNINTRRTYEISILNNENKNNLSSPSRSLDGRNIYFSNFVSGEVFALNTFSKIVFQTFNIGSKPIRPYTTPEGIFLYMIDQESGRFISIDQQYFEEYENTIIGEDINLITVGRFDRMNLLASSDNKNYYIYDNVRKSIVDSGEFKYTPLTSLGSHDGKTAYIPFKDSPYIGVINLENKEVSYIEATNMGIGAFNIGLSNNVCH